MVNRKKNPRTSAFALDICYICIGLGIVIMAILCFLNPVDYGILFPVIFLLASILNLLNGLVRLKSAGRNKIMKAYGVFFLIFGLLLLVLSAISGISHFGGYL